MNQIVRVPEWRGCPLLKIAPAAQALELMGIGLSLGVRCDMRRST